MKPYFSSYCLLYQPDDIVCLKKEYYVDPKFLLKKGKVVYTYKLHKATAIELDERPHNNYQLTIDLKYPNGYIHYNCDPNEIVGLIARKIR